MKKRQSDIFFILLILLALVLIVDSVLISRVNAEVSKSIAEAKELARPADIKLTVIDNPKCVKCQNVGAIVESIKAGNNIKSENRLDFMDSEAQSLISRYQIEKIPTIIVTGELEKAKLPEFEKRSDAMVLKDVAAPYTDASDGEIKGLVGLKLIKDSKCEKCTDLTSTIQQLKQSIVVDKEETVEFDSKEGKELVAGYDLKKIPALILSSDVSFYPLAQSWQQLGTVEGDGSYVMTTINPPFINTTTNKVVGLVEVTYLNDSNCKDCYDVTSHRAILLRYGINPVKENTVDVSSKEGVSLIKKYNITKGPTIIVSKEASYYSSLNNVWKQVGVTAEDGSYVLTKPEVMGKYVNLTGG